VKRTTAGLLTRILRRRISRKPSSPIRRSGPYRPVLDPLESRDPTGNLVGGLVAAALGGQLIEPLALMARAVGDWALLGGALSSNGQAGGLSPAATQTFSALPARDAALPLAAASGSDSQSGGSRAEHPATATGYGLSIGLSPLGLSDDPFWVGSTPADLSGEVPASAPMGLPDSSPWLGAGIGVSSALTNAAGGASGATDGLAGPAGSAFDGSSAALPTSTAAASGTGPAPTTNAMSAAISTAVLSPAPLDTSVPSPVASPSSGAVQAPALPTATVSGASGSATPAYTSASSSLSAPLTGSAPPAVSASLVTGSDAGSAARVKTFDPATGAQKLNFVPYGNNFTGGVRVASADLNADGVADIITGPGHGGGSQVRVFNGTTGSAFAGARGSFNAFSAGATDGVFVATGDVNGDGTPDIVVGTEAGASSPAVKVFSGTNAALLRTITLASDFSGGARVAAGDVNGDGKADIIVAAGPGGPPRVEVFDGSNGKPIQDYFAFDPSTRNGVYVAAGDLNGDGRADVIAGNGSGSEVRAFSGKDTSFLLSMAAFDPSFTGGVRVGVSDANGDGQPDVVAAAGPGGGEVRLFDGRTAQQIRAITPYGATFTDGTFAAGVPGPPSRGVTPLDVQPTVTIAATTPGAMEGGGTDIVFTVTRDGDTTNALQVNLLVGGGTAMPGVDHNRNAGQTGTIIPAGSATGTFTVTPTDDTLFEQPETVVVGLYPGPYNFGTPSSATGVIYDNDAPPAFVPSPGAGGDKVGLALGLSQPPPSTSDSGVRYTDGAINVPGVDLMSFGFGEPWGATRGWSSLPGIKAPGTSGNAEVVADLPYLLRQSVGMGGETVVAVGSGSSVRYFDKPNMFSGYGSRYSLQETMAYNSGAGEYTLTDTTGARLKYYDFNTSLPAAQRGQLKSYTGPDGHTITPSYNGSGQVTVVQRSVTVGGTTTTESLSYSYVGSGVNAGKVASVMEQRQVGGGSAQTVRETDYTYYDGSDSNGNAGDLKLAVIKDASGNTLDTQYYRYYTSSGGTGYQGGLKYEFGFDSYARLGKAVADAVTTGTLPPGTTVFTAPDSFVAPYADQAPQYNAAHQVTQDTVQGQGCSVCSGGQGTYTYGSSVSAFADGYNNWRNKTVETLPDGNQHTVYTNFAGEVMLDVFKDTTTSQQWETYYRYDTNTGRLILKADPSAVTGFDETTPELLNNQQGNYQYLADSTGLIENTSYYSSTTATGSTPGGVLGYQYQTSVQRGESGTAVLQSTTDYISHSDGTNTVYQVVDITVYRNSDGSGGQTTSYAYTWYAGTNQQQSVVVTHPVVTTAQNGPGGTTGDQETTFLDAYGRPVWQMNADGFINYTAYDDASGAVTKTIKDVDTTRTSDFTGLPTGWTTPTGGGLHLVTTMEVDSLGRTTKRTDPVGNVTYTVYDDVNHAVRTYAGWDSTNHIPTGPTVVQRQDQTNNYTEVLTMTATPALDGNGRPTGTEAISGLQTLKRTAMNSAGQVTDQYDYFNLAGIAYATTLALGTENTNYYRTRYSYDSFGRRNRVQSPSGTIYRTVYDGMGRKSSEWVGTNDTPGSGYWSPSNNTPPSNMVKVKDYTYDGGGVGDSDLTKVVEHPGGGAADRETDYFYDWRDRQVASKSGMQSTEDVTTHRPISYVTYDNLGGVTRSQRYDGDRVTITDANADGVPDAPSSSLLRAQTDSAYDERGRVYQTTVYSINPSTGAVSSTGLVTNSWFNRRGEVVKVSEPGGLVTKSAFDGAGRPTVQDTTDGGGDTSWSDAVNVIDDAVLQQTETQYDADGNAILVTTRQRFHDETATGALGNPTTSPKARASYQAMYYDAANRPIVSVDVGTNGGTAYTRPSSVPAPSDTVLLIGTAYNGAGWVDTATDPKGLVTKSFYDNLGRVTKQVQDYTDGVVTNNTNKTVEYTYDGSGHMLTLQADLPSGAYERTQYVYGTSTGAGDAITSNDFLKEVHHPDPTTGAPSSTLKDTYTLNALGQVVTATDRNGNVHTYSYDVLGRITSDAVTTLGAGVDGSVRRIEVVYDTQGNPYLITSYDAATAGNIVNEVQRTFNGLGQVTAEYQSHSGAVNTSTTPKVQYTYSEMAGGANHSRLTSITYPNGKVLTYNYSSGLNDPISRLSSMSDSTGTLESYDYLGLGSVVRRSHPQPGLDLTYIKQTGESNGDAGDQYTGLDRFGRIVDHRSIKTSPGTATDRFQYGYDRDSNRTYRDNQVNTAFGEVYTYDNLSQLSSFQRGTLNATKNGIVGTPSRSQSWNFDAAGNWSSATSDGTTQTRTHNDLNQITSVSGATTPTYDTDGNLTMDETGKHFVYDAWNRLVTVKNASNVVIASYNYDGQGWRVTETKSGTTRDFYYSDQWQVLEERVGGQAQVQYVWSPVYVDALVFRDRDVDGNPANGLEERLWAQQGATFEVTALVDGTGSVVERYAYDAFGKVTVYDANWTVRTGGSAYGMLYLFQGLRFDTDTQLYEARHRFYSPTLGRWLQVDPLGFGSGDVNWYRAVSNSPTNYTDPGGQTVYLISRPIGPARHYTIVVVSPDGKIVITYDGAGPSYPHDTDGRPIPQRCYDKTMRIVKTKYFDTKSGIFIFDPNQPQENLNGGPAVYQVDAGPNSTFEDELARLEYGFQYLWQLPYNIFGPNSNTYAHVLLELAAMKVKPVLSYVCVGMKPAGLGDIYGGLTFDYQWQMTDRPMDATGWGIEGTGYGPKPLPVPPNFKPSIPELQKPGGPAFQKPKPPSSSSRPLFPPGGACFVAGTLILTQEGFKPIEDIRVGDSVQSWNEVARRFECQPVAKLFTAMKEELYHIRGKGWELTCSAEHPFLVADRSWRIASQMREGDMIHTISGSTTPVLSIEKQRFNEAVQVYNFHVDETHTYCVTSAGLVVHNKPP
jgi:RHS repeat-associated protein